MALLPPPSPPPSFTLGLAQHLSVHVPSREVLQKNQGLTLAHEPIPAAPGWPQRGAGGRAPAWGLHQTTVPQPGGDTGLVLPSAQRLSFPALHRATWGRRGPGEIVPLSKGYFFYYYFIYFGIGWGVLFIFPSS